MSKEHIKYTISIFIVMFNVKKDLITGFSTKIFSFDRLSFENHVDLSGKQSLFSSSVTRM